MDDATADGRPVGGTEYSWCRAVEGGTGITVLALLLSRPVSRRLLDSALHQLQSSHPLLRAHLVTAASRHPFFAIATPRLEVLRLLSSSDLLPPPPASVSAVSVSPFHAVLEHEFNQNPWSDGGPTHPVLFATLYEMPEPGRSTLALRLHTAVCDRTSAVAVLKELLALMAASGEGIHGEADGFNRGIDDLIPKQDAWKPFWARGKDLVGYSLNALRTSTLRFEDAASERRSQVARLVLGTDDTQKLLTACKKRGIKLCGALSAAAMVATHASKQWDTDRYETYLIITLIDCRKYLDPPLHDHNIGFYHSAIINTHSIHGGEGLWEVAERCQCSYSTAMTNKKHLKDIGEVNYLMCRAIDHPHLTNSSSLRIALISVFEEPVVYESSAVLQHQLGVDDYVGCASAHGVGPSIAVFDTIRDGQLDCACVYPSPLHSRKQMQELVEQMKRILRDDDSERSTK
ncbi:transposon protein [Musa troglodytarum]|uniref:Transposon protein n=1 Tax=Musa troglodytarum TaxID=320322 RepID=A0A9E7EV93_9LILI|nr:transposon protein [Musa troglodytarum]